MADYTLTFDADITSVKRQLSYLQREMQRIMQLIKYVEVGKMQEKMQTTQVTKEAVTTTNKLKDTLGNIRKTFAKLSTAIGPYAKPVWDFLKSFASVGIKMGTALAGLAVYKTLGFVSEGQKKVAETVEKSSEALGDIPYITKEAEDKYISAVEAIKSGGKLPSSFVYNWVNKFKEKILGSIDLPADVKENIGKDLVASLRTGLEDAVASYVDAINQSGGKIKFYDIYGIAVGISDTLKGIVQKYVEENKGKIGDLSTGKKAEKLNELIQELGELAFNRAYASISNIALKAPPKFEISKAVSETVFAAFGKIADKWGLDKDIVGLENIFGEITVSFTDRIRGFFSRFAEAMKSDKPLENALKVRSEFVKKELDEYSKEVLKKITTGSELPEHAKPYILKDIKEVLSSMFNIIFMGLTDEIKDIPKLDKRVVTGTILQESQIWELVMLANITAEDAEKLLENNAEALISYIKTYEALYELQRVEPDRYRVLSNVARLFNEPIERVAAMYALLSGVAGQVDAEAILELKRSAQNKDIFNLSEIFALINYLVTEKALAPRDVIEEIRKLAEARETQSKFYKLRSDLEQLGASISNILNIPGAGIEDIYHILKNTRVPIDRQEVLDFISKYEEMMQIGMNQRFKETIGEYQEIVNDPKYQGLLSQYAGVDKNAIFDMLSAFKSTKTGAMYDLMRKNIAYIQNSMKDFAEDYFVDAMELFDRLKEKNLYAGIYALFNPETGLPNFLGNILITLSKINNMFSIENITSFIANIVGNVSSFVNTIVGAISNILEVLKSIKDLVLTIKEYLVPSKGGYISGPTVNDPYAKMLQHVR